ncbi:hypothetical protein AGMMS49992_12710 [Clostridia bacterium]|nr:hypothetical protein AGMMS49992_12710 [Clostridia bacterium]
MDVWGEQERNDNALARVVSEFFSPGFTSNTNLTARMAEIDRLFSETGEAGVIPSAAIKYFTSDKVRYDLTAEQYADFSTVRGQTAAKLIDTMISSKTYQESDATRQAALLKDAWSLATDQAKPTVVTGYNPTGWLKEAGAHVAKGDYDAVLRTMVTRQDEKDATAAKANMRGALFEAIDGGDSDGALTAVTALKEAGSENGGIKTSLTSHYKPLYKDAVESGDITTVKQIEDMLMSLGVGYKLSTIMGWAD